MSPAEMAAELEELHQLLPTLLWLKQELAQLNLSLQRQAHATSAADAAISTAQVRSRSSGF